ncbi:hypothetical protein Bca52824_080057 [Brassica carinata]|uniref:Disease resistance protein At4g27190-like leucine-rich repeats domain-containing protein n=1 Tax=Brassica carinata TaxID=52824 RepID=A0A8X7Q2J4_BRACI|nr:hypothetical protein Bca52824_080057 [Brassica carinata]
MLTHLNLEGTGYLESLEGISGLSSLRTLKLLDSNVRLDMSLMKKLQPLEHLEYVSVNISTSTLGGGKLFYDSRMGRCIQKAYIYKEPWEEEPVKVIVLPAWDGLRDIYICRCEMLEEIKIEKTPWNKSLTSPCFSNLTQVNIRDCKGLKDLTWLLFVRNLTHLHVLWSWQLEDIISKEKAGNVLENNIIPFQKLEVLILVTLPQLKSIYWNALPFQRLRYLDIRGNCQKLRKLPLNSKSVVDVEKLVIYCPDKEWLERVEWEEEATRLRFLPSSIEDLKAVRSDLLRKVHAAEEGGGLQRLYQIESIYRSHLLFPCLKKIDLERCPTLRKLPLSSGSCVGGDELVISYRDDHWIERVHWEDKATGEIFLLCCEKVIMASYPGDL